MPCSLHRFEPQAPATGYWEKRPGAGDGIYVQGMLEVCRTCGAMRLRPENPEMQVVEVTR